MPNLLDYLAWRGDLPLQSAPWCDVDSLLMACLCYVQLHEAEGDTRLTPGQMQPPLFRDKIVNRFFEKCRSLYDIMAQSVRFGDIELHHYEDIFDQEREMQFAAVSADLPDGTCLIAFRGTDATLIGWREDFNMSYESPVPSQTEALRYLQMIAGQTERPLRLCGHSKGGNLAVYAATYAPEAVQARIERVWSFDGPGLDDASSACEGYARIKPRITSMIPQGSVIGLLLAYHVNYRVVQAKAMGFFQHDAFTWQIYGPCFVEAEDVNASSRLLDDTLHDWLTHCTPEERKRFVDTVFDILMSTNARTFGEMTDEKLRSLGAMLTATRGVDGDTILLFLRLVSSFLRIGAGNVWEQIRKK